MINDPMTIISVLNRIIIKYGALQYYLNYYLVIISILKKRKKLRKIKPKLNLFLFFK